MVKTDKPDMQQPSHLVRFGKTDLYVSRVCQGTAFRNMPRAANNPMGLRVLQHCIDVGVNFFDSSNAYGWGGSEDVLGKAIAGRRDRVVICTKVAASHKPPTEDAEAKPARFTRDFLFRQAEGSLKRLGTDYIDLYLLHQPDQSTPAAEIVDSMDALVQAGKIRYWGVSNHSAAQVSEYVKLGESTSKAPITGIEDYYNIAGESLNDAGESRVHQLEQEMFPVLRRADLGLMAFSPLDTGHLVPGRSVQAGSPLSTLIGNVDEVAQDLGVGRAEVCVAWVLTHPEVTSVLAGAERPEHVEENVAGTRLVLPAEAIDVLSAASEAYRKQKAVEANR
ncbi:MAG: aldo/keto reductase [Candidatus Poribacteria bacterium]|nr:aldo/keto reductase [Candidatus Poribacteria bacterium]